MTVAVWFAVLLFGYRLAWRVVVDRLVWPRRVFFTEINCPRFHEEIVSLLLHALKQFLIVRKSFILYDFAYFPFNSTPHHSVDRVLLAMNSGFGGFLFEFQLYFGVKSEFGNRLLVFNLAGAFVSSLL
jgi:hypothetical protein